MSKKGPQLSQDPPPNTVKSGSQNSPNQGRYSRFQNQVKPAHRPPDSDLRKTHHLTTLHRPQNPSQVGLIGPSPAIASTSDSGIRPPPPCAHRQAVPCPKTEINA